MTGRDFPCVFCAARDHEAVGEFDAPPPGEIDFGFAPYHRVLWLCRGCGHVVNRHDFDLEEEVDQGIYAQATYGAERRAFFQRVMALPPEESDNLQRVARVNRFAQRHGWGTDRRCLDIGSGLGVFPAALATSEWQCVAHSRSAQGAEMIADLAGVETWSGDFMAMSADRRFNLVSFTRLLARIRTPIGMLAHARSFLDDGGAVYIELPDGEAALDVGGPEREEFFVEHFDAYSFASAALLVRKAGFRVVEQKRLREPSGKYTIAAFAVPG